jgi:cortactin
LGADVSLFFSMNKLRAETAEADAILKQKQLEEGPKAAFGYGGKFGVQTDRFVLIQSYGMSWHTVC